MVPLRRAIAANVIREFTRRVIYRHGCPDLVISDNGTQFTSRQIEDAFKSFGVKHQTSPTYTPQCNPVERANRTVKTMIAQYVGKKHRRWDEYILQLQFAYNTARQAATGYTPAFLVHGRELRFPHPEDRLGATPTATPGSARHALQDAYEVVRINLARAFQHQQQHYDLRRRDWRPRVGDRVWKRDHPLSNKARGFNAKLAPKYVGPMTVRRIISPVIIDLRDERGRWHRQVHVQDIKPVSQAADETLEEGGERTG
ncbi:hypothetical protein ACFW04_012197 [Cataglyphis niger]